MLRQGYETPRRWPRYNIDVPVRLFTQLPKKVAVQSRGKQLGCGGMAVVAAIDLAIGEQVAVEFTPPSSGQPIRVRAFVRNRKDQEYGIEFITENDIDYNTVQALEAILRSLGSVCEVE